MVVPTFGRESNVINRAHRVVRVVSNLILLTVVYAILDFMGKDARQTAVRIVSINTTFRYVTKKVVIVILVALMVSGITNVAQFVDLVATDLRVISQLVLAYMDAFMTISVRSAKQNAVFTVWSQGLYLEGFVMSYMGIV